MSRIVENRCKRARVVMEGKTYQCFSILLERPNMVKEDDWKRLYVNDEWILVDSMSMQLLSKCVVEWLTAPNQHTIQACRLSVPEGVDDVETFWKTLVL